MVPRIVALVLMVVLVVFVAVMLTVGATKPAEKAEAEKPSVSQIGRHLVVRATAEEIIIIDTVDGTLYRALPSDIKPYKDIFGTESEAPAEEMPAADAESD